MRCEDCEKEITEIGFECETFSICKDCCDAESDAWKEFQVVMKPEIEFLEKYSPFCIESHKCLHCSYGAKGEVYKFCADCFLRQQDLSVK